MDANVDSVSAADVMLLRRATGIPVLAAKEYLRDASPVLRSRLLIAAQRKLEDTELVHQYLYDPIEDAPSLRNIFVEVEKQVRELLKDKPRQRNLCHCYWTTQKRILAEKYGIEWFTPQQMNPGCFFC